MKNAICLSVVAAAILLVSSAQTVEAQDYIYQNYVGGGYGGFGNFGTFGSPYALDRIPTPPYFAVHPPVYYSQPVPRTYGYSPFAYPGITRTPDVETVPTAKIIENPHVTPAQATQKLDANLTTQLEIVNPYFVPRQTRVVSREAK